MSELKKENGTVASAEGTKSSVTEIYKILTCNGTVDIHAMSGILLVC